MARDLTPKFKRSRREGMDLHPDLDKAGTAKSPLIRKAYRPGAHGPKMSRSKLSNYGAQLREKQKAKRVYGILERQFRNYYKKALRAGGQTGDVILSLLESRLDNSVYRLGFAKTRPAARQMVSHGHIIINGTKAKTPSILVKQGDSISVIQRIAQDPKFQEKIHAIDRRVPSWLTLSGTEAKVVANPDIAEPKMLIDVRRIVEFYSR
ncbi:MAG: 30S ribosomal protein S4 [Parcubacteria group bacterium CG1_02_41_12]|nr:MAG: 30S ribosomal protein S4 [Parcubacteria group bacterium CG1_02_41_12]